MNRKTKQLITILVLCVILAAALCGYVVLDKTSKDKTEEVDTDTEISLYSMEESEIVSLEVVHENTRLSFEKDTEKWICKEDKEFPLDQESIETMVESSASVTAIKHVVDHPEELSEYRLDPPEFQITLTDRQGETNVLAIGMQSVAAEGCYAYVNQPDRIYIIASNITDSFSYTKNQLMETPEIPSVEAANVTGFSLEKKQKTVFAANFDEKNAEFSDVDGWDITKPYEQVTPGSSSELQTLFENLSSLSITEGVEYKGSAKALAQYGLKTPKAVLTFSYIETEVDEEEDEEDKKEEEEHTLSIKIGEYDDLEQNYYVSLDGEQGIYLMSSERIDAFLEINAFDYVSKPLHNADLSTVKKISFTLKSKTYEYQIKAEEVEDAVEEGSYHYTITRDGKKMDVDEFKSAYADAFDSLVYSGVNESEKEKAKSGQKIASLTIETKYRTWDYSFYPYDGDNFYQVQCSGQKDFLVDINVLESALLSLADVLEEK